MKGEKMNILSSVISVTLPLCLIFGAYASDEATPPVSKQHAKKFETQITMTVQLNYLLYLPKEYGSEKDKKYPLILFLHGAGERGDDLNKVKVHGIPKIIEREDDFPFIAVSPQCPANSWWTFESELIALNALLDDIVSKFSVDEDRIYLTGISMGGFGTWALAMKYPERFAAIVPICGGGDPKNISAIKDIPAWVFHGAKDNTVKLEESEKMVNALKECGGNVQFTVYPDADHDSWTVTYDNPELYKWLLEQSRNRNNGVLTNQNLTTCASLVCSSSIYRTFIKTLNELSYYKLSLFLNLRELAQVVNLLNHIGSGLFRLLRADSAYSTK